MPKVETSKRSTFDIFTLFTWFPWWKNIYMHCTFMGTFICYNLFFKVSSDMKNLFGIIHLFQIIILNFVICSILYFSFFHIPNAYSFWHIWDTLESTGYSLLNKQLWGKTFWSWPHLELLNTINDMVLSNEFRHRFGRGSFGRGVQDKLRNMELEDFQQNRCITTAYKFFIRPPPLHDICLNECQSFEIRIFIGSF